MDSSQGSGTEGNLLPTMFALSSFKEISFVDWGSGWSDGMDYIYEENQQISSPDVNGSQDDVNTILNSTRLVNGGKLMAVMLLFLALFDICIMIYSLHSSG